MVGGGDVGEVLAVLEEQQRLGGVGAVEPAAGDEVRVEGAATGQAQLGGEQDRHRPVGCGRHYGAPGGVEVDFDDRLGVGGGPR